MGGREPGPFQFLPLKGGDVVGQTAKARALRCAPGRADHIGIGAGQQPANRNVSSAPLS